MQRARHLLVLAVSSISFAALAVLAGPIASGALASSTSSRAPSGAARAPQGMRARRHLRTRCRSRGAARRRGRADARRGCRRRPARPRPSSGTAALHSVLRPGAGAVSATAQDASARIAAVLATPCQNTEVTPEPANRGLVRGAVLCLVNRERAINGVPPLSANERLAAAAEEHCAELVADDYFAHVSPSGETPVNRISATGYIPGPSVGYVIGENLAWGTYGLATPQAIVSAWVASPGHLANILEAKYTETGIGVTPAVPSSLAAGAPGATYAQEFGVIVPAA